MSLQIWALLIPSYWVVAILAQKECLQDTDCLPDNQYCNYQLLPKRCFNFTICILYNREEALKPSREASDCGRCINGYFAKKTGGPDAETSEACTKSVSVIMNEVSRNDKVWTPGMLVKYILPLLIAVVIIVAIINLICSCKPCSKDKITADGLSPQSSRRNLNNNKDKFNHAVETNLQLAVQEEQEGTEIVATVV